MPESGGAAGDLLFNRQPGSAKRGRPLKRLLPKAAFKRAFTINLLFHICEGELKPAPRRLLPWLCAAGGGSDVALGVLHLQTNSLACAIGTVACSWPNIVPLMIKITVFNNFQWGDAGTCSALSTQLQVRLQFPVPIPCGFSVFLPSL